MSYDLLESKSLAVVGLLAAIYWGLCCLCKLCCGIRIFLWARIAPNRDLVKMYGKWAVITGSTDGIGKEHAKILAGRGLNLCLISRNAEKLDITAKEIKRDADVEIKCIQADFTNAACYDLIKKGLAEIDDIGILMNNVGTMNELWEPFEEETESFLRDLINVNILSIVLMTRIVLPRMTAKKRGLIVNVSSMAGFSPLPYSTAYSSSKAMVTIFSLCLSEELRNHNVQVVCLEPGFVKSNMTRKMTDYKTIIPSFVMPTAEKYSRSASTVFNLKGSFTTTGFWIHGLLTTIQNVLLTRDQVAWMIAKAHRFQWLGKTRKMERA